ncbi:TolC family protein [Geofilum sp. OHC36d9]|uniref:TolC family protein n=1 Tax=Geofilum sp. OHC36d9 TaxID=3458413 RepID=UPI00403477AF
MKEILITFSLMVSLSLVAQDNPPVMALSFEEALQKALLQNETLQQSALHHLEAEQEAKAARGLRMPQVSLSANYVMMSEDITIDMTGVRDAITPIYSALSQYGTFSGVPNPDPATSGVMPILTDEISTAAVRQQLADGLVEVQNGEWDKTIQQKNFGLVSTNVMWPLFTGGKINAANKVAQLKINESELINHQKTAAIYRELTERYFGLALAWRVTAVRKEVLEAMQLHLSDAEKLNREGIISKAELLHAQVFHAQADREYKKAQRDCEVVNEALRNTLAENEVVSITPITALFYLKEIESADFFKQMARFNNPQLLQVESKKAMAGEGVKAQRSDFMPTIAAIGTYNLADYQLSPNIPTYMGGVTLSWKLFGGGASRHQYKAALLVEDQVDQVHQKAIRDIETGIEKYHHELMMTLEQLEELESADQFASEYYRVQKQAFAEGMATSSDVVDASLATTKVHIEQLQAAYQYEIALARLLELAGATEQFNEYRNNSQTIVLNQ